MDISRFDLNLLKTLDYLEQERSVQRAAARLHLTASAVSHSLARLRRNLSDPLFVRSGNHLVPTERCKKFLAEMRPLLSSVALALDQTLQPGQGDQSPLAERRQVRMVMPGAVELSLLPALTRHVLERAPNWILSTRGFERRSYEEDLLAGNVDVVLSIGGHTGVADGIAVSTFWHDELVAIQSTSGPLSPTQATPLDRLIDLPQVYPLPWPPTQNYFDIQLARQGAKRAIAVHLPSYATLGRILSGSHLIAIVPDRTALAIVEQQSDLQIVEIYPRVETELKLETSDSFRRSSAGEWFLSQLRLVSHAIRTLRE